MEEKQIKKKFKIKNIKHKKTVIFVFLIIVFIAFRVISNIVNPKEDETNKIEKESIEKRSLATSISATGKIVANDKKTITTTLTGSKIKTVNVKEGDKVSVGDVICTFDTADIADNLAKAQTSLNVSKQQNDLSIQGAKRSLSDAIANRDTQISSSNSDLKSAEKAYKDVESELNNAKANLETLKSQRDSLTEQYNTAKIEIINVETDSNNLIEEYNKLKADYDAKKNAVDTAKSANDASQNAVNTAKQAYDNAVENSTGTEEEKQNIDKLKSNLDTAQTNLSKTTKELEQAQNLMKQAETAFKSVQNTKSTNNTDAQKAVIQNYEDLISQITTLEETIKSLQSNLDSLYSTYDKAKIAYNSTVESSNSTVASMQDSLKNSELTASVSTQAQETQIRTYKEQLADGILTATVNGVVTSVGVKPGDIYTGSAIAVIDGADELIVESEIDEYDIADVEVGMKVLIKTDATRDEELEGTVIYTAPSATESLVGASTASVGTNSYATYTVKISLDTPNDRLRLGMNAKLSIITNKKDDIWTVPYSAIRERENGDKYIIINRKDSEEDEELDITVGLEGLYYIEVISDKLEEGMKVVLPPIEAENSIDALIELMGADGGL